MNRSVPAPLVADRVDDQRFRGASTPGGLRIFGGQLLAQSVAAAAQSVFDSVLTSRGLCWGQGRMVIAAVEANISFHGPVRFDDWLLYVTECGVQVGTGRG